jgi:hypothetical protein
MSSSSSSSSLPRPLFCENGTPIPHDDDFEKTMALYAEKYAAILPGVEVKNREFLFRILREQVIDERLLEQEVRMRGSVKDMLAFNILIRRHKMNADAHAEALRKRYILGDAGDGPENYGDGDQSDLHGTDYWGMHEPHFLICKNFHLDGMDVF